MIELEKNRILLVLVVPVWSVSAACRKLKTKQVGELDTPVKTKLYPCMYDEFDASIA